MSSDFKRALILLERCHMLCTSSWSVVLKSFIFFVSSVNKSNFHRYPSLVITEGSDGTHQLLAYADDVYILGGSVDTVKENAEALVAATKEIRLEVNAHKTKYMTVSRDQNAG